MSEEALGPQFDEYRRYRPGEGDRPPYFTGEVGPQGGPMWSAPTYSYHGPQEVAPEIHGLTEHPAARYISQIMPTVQISAGGGSEEEQGQAGHYVTATHWHPRWVEDVRQRYPNAKTGLFEVRYYHGADQPALEGTQRSDISDLQEPGGPPIPDPISHEKSLYIGDDPREAQRATVEAVARIHQFTRGRREP